jgi:hypothetical protein
MPEFTPGPWHIESLEMLENAVIAFAGYVVSIIKPIPGGMEIAEANARLISTAPELFEALKAVEWGYERCDGELDCCPNCHEPEEKGHDKDCQLAAAIRKVEGK